MIQVVKERWNKLWINANHNVFFLYVLFVHLMIIITTAFFIMCYDVCIVKQTFYLVLASSDFRNYRSLFLAHMLLRINPTNWFYLYLFYSVNQTEHTLYIQWIPLYQCLYIKGRPEGMCLPCFYFMEMCHFKELKRIVLIWVNWTFVCSCEIENGHLKALKCTSSSSGETVL